MALIAPFQEVHAWSGRQSDANTEKINPYTNSAA